MIEIVDQSNSDLYSQNQDLINNFTDYSSKNLDFDKPVKVYFMDDEENAKDPLGKTAHYNPDTLEIKIYVTGRHLKDILRSISHELIHHVQNCRGDFGSLDSTEAGYAQSNDHLRGMEQEAYTQGNIMNFRDFEDNYKRGTKTMSETKINKLKAMVREGVREVLQEQSRTYSGGGSGRSLDLGSDWNKKIKQLRDGDVQQLSQFILDKADDDFISNDEMTVMYLGTEEVIKKGKICDLTKLLEKGTYTSKGGYNRGREVQIDIDYLVSQFKNTTFLNATYRGYRQDFITNLKRGKNCKAKPADGTAVAGGMSSAPAQVPAPTAAGGMSSAPASTSGQSSAKCVTDCPQGSGAVASAEYPAGVCEKDGQIVALICDPDAPSQAKQATTTGKAKRYKKEGCDKLPVGKGCQSDLVKEIQRHLGFKGSDIDGKFWTKTERAVIRFQKNSGISPANGIVDQKTLETLKANRRPARRGGPQAPAPAGAAASAGPAPAPAGAAASAGPAPAPATSVSKPKYAGVRPGSKLEKSLDREEDQRDKPESERRTFFNTRVWINQIGNSSYGPGSPKEKLAKVIKAALLKKGYLERPYNSSLLEEFVTIEQKKLNEAKSLFDRLKKVL